MAAHHGQLPDQLNHLPARELLEMWRFLDLWQAHTDPLKDLAK